MADLPQRMVDEETGEVVPVTEEMRLEARRVHEDIAHHGARTVEHMLGLGNALGQMRDKRLFLAMGFASFERYCRTSLGVARDWADRRVQVAEFIEQNAATVRQLPNISQSSILVLAKLPTEMREEFLQTHPVADMSKRELEEAVREANRAKREAEEAKRRATEAEAKARDLANRPPQVVEKTVEVVKPDPEATRRLVEMRKEYDQVVRRLEQLSRERDALSGKLDKTADLDAQIRSKRTELDRLKAIICKMSVDFEDGHRDPNGGERLMTAMMPVEAVILKAIGDAILLKDRGVGGQMADDRIKELSGRLKQLAAILDAILSDRESRPINVTPMEV